MDFSFDEGQQAAHDLALQILGDKMTMERHLEIEASGDWFARAEWDELAKAGLLGVHLGEGSGGGGLDLVAFGAVLMAQGYTVAPMPLLQNGLAALAVETFGTDEQRRRWLPGAIDGTGVLTLGIQELYDDRLDEPQATVSGGTVTGNKAVVEFLPDATRVLITARTEAGSGLFLLDPAGPGVTVTEGRSTRLQPVYFLELDGAPVEAVGDDTAGTVTWLVERAVALLCATQTGVTERALQLTAEYTSTREQFGRPIATFQAVTQRLADQYINVEGIRLCTLSALWHLAHGLPATDDVHIAKYWASARAQDIAHATQHCHGGMGVSTDYPLHRYTLWNKHLATSLGAGTQQLRTIGAAMAAG